MIVGGTDGMYHALKVNTGEKIWSIEVSKRAILNSALVRDNVAYITHGEENIDTTEMGLVAAVDAAKGGVLAADAFKWRTRGFLPTFASPVMDDERLYTMDNSAIVGAFDLKTGAKLWEKTLGTLQKGSPVLADGKLYVGTENGKFYILRPSATGVEVLDEDVLGSPQSPEAIVASPIVADGRVYVTSMDAMYAIGKRVPVQGAVRRVRTQCARGARRTGAPAVVQVFPYEALLAPGQTVALKARLFDAKGNFIREEPAATWAVDQASGSRRCEGRLHRREERIDRGLREGDGRHAHRPGARARDRGAALDVRFRERRLRSAAGLVGRRADQGVAAHRRRRRQGVDPAAR